MDEWINLHCHSEYSIVNGQDGAIGNPLERVQQAKKLGQKALSLTDHGTLIGIPEHLEACRELGLKPIVGWCILMVISTDFAMRNFGRCSTTKCLLFLGKNTI